MTQSVAFPSTAAPRGGALPAFLQPPSQAQAQAPGFVRDAWTGGTTAPTLQATATAASGGGLIGWLVGAAVGAFYALPRLARFGPAGLLTSVLVVLAGGWYGGSVVGAGQATLAGDVRPAVQVGAWFAGGRLALGLIQSWKSPGAFVAAAVIWLGSWGAGKLLDAVWKR